jgi:hypothetical protein
MTEIRVTLPGGLEEEGIRYRDARVRPVDGTDLDAMRSTVGQLPAERISALLARCVTRLGPREPPSQDDFWRLNVGDRDALTLTLRRAALGDTIDCVLTCPTCREPMDVELSASELLVPPYDHEPVRRLSGPSARPHTSVRAPTAGELEESARETDPKAGTRRLLARCLMGERSQADEFDDEFESAVAALVAELDPQADLQLDMICPHCNAPLLVPFDPVSFLLRELDDRADALFQEVHALALRYHWSERDILKLPLAKRRLYLALLDESTQPAAAS